MKITFQKNDVKCIVQEFVVLSPPQVDESDPIPTLRVSRFRVFVDGGFLPNGNEYEFYDSFSEACQAAREVVEYLD